jgi:hypothetical protein
VHGRARAKVDFVPMWNEQTDGLHELPIGITSERLQAVHVPMTLGQGADMPF